MRFHTQRHLLAAVVFLSFAQLGRASGPSELQIGYWGSSFAGCGTIDSLRHGDYVVGGIYDFTIRLYPTREGTEKYQGITDWTWPKGLVIKVGLSGGMADSCRIYEALREKIGLEYYVTDDQKRQDSLWRATGGGPAPIFFDCSSHFRFQIPPELAGSYLCMTAEWNHPTHGFLKSPNEARIRIAEPCSEAALHHVWTSQVEHAEQEGTFDKAICLTDSFLARGWHSFSGLVAAASAASKAGRTKDLERVKELLSKEPVPVPEE